MQIYDNYEVYSHPEHSYQSLTPTDLILYNHFLPLFHLTYALMALSMSAVELATKVYSLSIY